ncbi:MAG: hypothetical protein QXI33_02295 [Candidatus Pacearchaeota archaeon]
MDKKEFGKSLTLVILITLLFFSVYYAYDKNKFRFLQNKVDVDNNDIYSNNFIYSNQKNSNGIVTNIWFHDKEKLNLFKNNNIRYLFVDVGNIDSNGNLLTKNPEIREFIDFIENYEEKNNYDFILLPYTEVILENYEFNEIFQDNLAQTYYYLSVSGFDGAHVDIEAIPIEKRDEYINFIELLRGKMRNKIISVYPGLISEDQNEWEWNLEFYHKVYEIVDLITIGSYDTGLKDNEYRTYIKDQINTINANFEGKFMFIAPTHKEYPETIDNSLFIFKSNYKNSEKSAFIGIGMFAEWTTDEEEWKVFEKYQSEFS